MQSSPNSRKWKMIPIHLHKEVQRKNRPLNFYSHPYLIVYKDFKHDLHCGKATHFFVTHTAICLACLICQIRCTSAKEQCIRAALLVQQFASFFWNDDGKEFVFPRSCLHEQH